MLSAIKDANFLAKMILFVYALTPLTACLSSDFISSTSIANPSFMRGVNISHYLSQVPYADYANTSALSESDLQWIAAQGYDHIRLPVDGPLLLSSNKDLRLNRLRPIDKVLEWAFNNGLSVILDMHKLPGSDFAMNPDNRLFTSPVLQHTASEIWSALAHRYKAVGPELRFEILNEPVAENHYDLTRFYEKMIRVIRQQSPDRTLLLCSNKWGSFNTVQHLEPLLSHPNIVIAVHYYDPHVFTHQGAPWVKLDHPELPQITFPGIVPEMSPFVPENHYALRKSGTTLAITSISEDFKKLTDWATSKGADLHLGEFGVYTKADPDSRERWYRAVLEQCTKYKIGWAVWDYKGAFAVRDKTTGEPTPVQDIILNSVHGL